MDAFTIHPLEGSRRVGPNFLLSTLGTLPTAHRTNSMSPRKCLTFLYNYKKKKNKTQTLQSEYVCEYMRICIYSRLSTDTVAKYDFKYFFHERRGPQRPKCLGFMNIWNATLWISPGPSLLSNSQPVLPVTIPSQFQRPRYYWLLLLLLFSFFLLFLLPYTPAGKP